MLQSTDLNFTHEQQQEAVEIIHQLMQEGMSSGEAIALVAQAMREKQQNTQKTE